MKNLFNEQTFLQILRSRTFSDDEYVQYELNVVADLLEEYGVESASKLKQKLLTAKRKSSSGARKTKYDLFVDECIFCIANRDAGQNVDTQIETLVQKFQELPPANIKKFAERFELLVSSKKDASKVRTWLQKGQKPLTSEEEKALFIGEITQLYQETNGNFKEENIQAILEIVEKIKDKYSIKELKKFVQTFEPDLTAGSRDALIQKWEARLRNVEPVTQSKPRRSSKQVKSLDLENNPYKDKINGLISAFKNNPTEEFRKVTISQILNVIEAIKRDYNFTQQKIFVQNVFNSTLTGRTEAILLSKTSAFIENYTLSVPNVPSQANHTKEGLLTFQTSNSLLDRNSVTSIESYVRQALQLRDEKSYELTDENILKIVQLGERVKKEHKIEGLKSFMDAIGVSIVGVKNGAWFERIKNDLEEQALMRFKAVRIQEM